MTSFVAKKLNKALPKAYAKQLAGTAKPFNGSREVAGEYDPATGPTTTTVNYSGRGVFGGYTVRETDGQAILINDVKLSGVLQNELLNDVTGEAEGPAVDDQINEYRVINWQQDPASATYSIQLRKT